MGQVVLPSLWHIMSNEEKSCTPREQKCKKELIPASVDLATSSVLGLHVLPLHQGIRTQSNEI